ncbi:MAG: helix-turn-helix transcriptional regulator [Thermodesulfobacteriota bacterium]
MPKARPYSKYTAEAARLLGRQIKLGRKLRRWSEHELAERAGMSRATLQKIEKGDPSTTIGLVFEVAAIVGVRLFDADIDDLKTHRTETDARLSLLPKHTHAPRHSPVDDDF